MCFGPLTMTSRPGSQNDSRAGDFVAATADNEVFEGSLSNGDLVVRTESGGGDTAAGEAATTSEKEELQQGQVKKPEKGEAARNSEKQEQVKKEEEQEEQVKPEKQEKPEKKKKTEKKELPLWNFHSLRRRPCEWGAHCGAVVVAWTVSAFFSASSRIVTSSHIDRNQK